VVYLLNFVILGFKCFDVFLFPLLFILLLPECSHMLEFLLELSGLLLLQ
jgi:hypothetical protein